MRSQDWMQLVILTSAIPSRWCEGCSFRDVCLNVLISVVLDEICNIIYIYIPGSPWSWKFPHQSQNRSILPNSREKELLNGYFHSRTLFLTPERIRTVLNAFWTLFERFFPLQNVRSVRNGKNHSGVLFFTPTPKIDLFWVWNLKIQYLEAPGIYYKYKILLRLYYIYDLFL